MVGRCLLYTRKQGKNGLKVGFNPVNFAFSPFFNLRNASLLKIVMPRRIPAAILSHFPRIVELCGLQTWDFGIIDIGLDCRKLGLWLNI